MAINTNTINDAYTDVFHALMSEAYLELDRATRPRVFVRSTGTKVGVDGLTKIVTERVATPGTTTAAALDAQVRAVLPTLMQKLATRLVPFTKIGELPFTTTNECLVVTDAQAAKPRNLTLRSRYTISPKGVRTFWYDVLAGN